MLTKPKVVYLDLDGTLYESALGIERQFVPSLRKAIARALGKTTEEAAPIIAELNRQYGYCVRGLQAEYGLDPSRVIEDSYNLVDRSGIVSNPRLQQALRKLSAQVPIFVLTNSSRSHARDALSRLGVADFVKGIVAIEDANFHLKPETPFYLAARELTGIPFSETLYFDDSVRNLHAAWMNGMKCVLVSNGVAQPPLFWENHLQINHHAPDHIPSTHNLPAFIEEMLEDFNVATV